MVDITPILTILISIGASAIISLFVIPTVDRRRQRGRSWSGLIAELEQNIRHQELSTFSMLEDDAYHQFRLAGFFNEQSEQLKESLRNLYSLVHEKNTLMVFYQQSMAGAPGNMPHIVDAAGGNPVPITNIISRIRIDIDREIGTLLPTLREASARQTDP